MCAQRVSDSAGGKRFLFKVTTASAFGGGLDGYDLGAISVVLPLITTEVGLSAVQQGALPPLGARRPSPPPDFLPATAAATSAH